MSCGSAHRRAIPRFGFDGPVAQLPYLSRALEASNGNKVEAAKLVGLPSYQTFTNWLARYGIKNRKEENG